MMNFQLQTNDENTMDPKHPMLKSLGSSQMKQSSIKASGIPIRRNALSNVTNSKLGQVGSKFAKGQQATKPVQETLLPPVRPQAKAIKRSASSGTTQEEGLKRSKKIEYEWEDLDEEDFDDPLMVSEYVIEIFEYLSVLEERTLPAKDYLLKQSFINSNMRDQLVDWMCEVHLKFRLLPETLFVAVNLMDRFLSREIVQVNKLQLLGTSCLFIASKYEEIYSPTVANFSNESGSTVEEILSAEKFVLEILEFDLSYPNPMNFLRRISKADDYDIHTRTLGKYFLEISIMDHRFIGIKPSLCSAASMYLARKMLGKNEWTGNLIHYSGEYFESDLKPITQLYIEYLVSPVVHEEFFKKYASKRFIKASIAARQWAKDLIKSGSFF